MSLTSVVCCAGNGLQFSGFSSSVPSLLIGLKSEFSALLGGLCQQTGSTYPTWLYRQALGRPHSKLCFRQGHHVQVLLWTLGQERPYADYLLRCHLLLGKPSKGLRRSLSQEKRGVELVLTYALHFPLGERNVRPRPHVPTRGSKESKFQTRVVKICPSL